MTEQDLKDIECRLEDAHTGDWIVSKYDKYSVESFETGAPIVRGLAKDVEFIAYAKQDVINLIAEVKRLRGWLKKSHNNKKNIQDVLYDPTFMVEVNK